MNERRVGHRALFYGRREFCENLAMSELPPPHLTDALDRAARLQPEQIAIRVPGPRHNRFGFARYDELLTFGELQKRSTALARGLLHRTPLERGDRVVVMLKPTLDFFVGMFALFRAGMVPVLIDPGIPRASLKQCLREADPQGFIGLPMAHLARRVLGWAPSANVHLTTGHGWFGNRRLRDLRCSDELELPTPGADDLAAILFTSGSTGVPKGVEYKHRHFIGQLELLRDAFGIEPGGTDFPTFPPFALFDPALGLTSVIPDMDARKPAQADARKLHDAMQRFGVEQLFGSPALMKVLAEYGKPLAGLRRVTSAGAPVPPATVAKIQALLPDDAKFWTPYGATECLPVAVIEGRQLLGTRIATEQGAGTCVGRPLPGNDVRIIRIVDGPIANWDETVACAPGEIGEITVVGPSTTEAYFNRPDLTFKAKISECDRAVHRMGDAGYLDAQGRLWFCGRLSQRVRTADGDLHTEQVEPIFNTHPSVLRSALVGVEGEPVVLVELDPRTPHSWDGIRAELRALAMQHPLTQGIKRFLPHRKFPVDIRHNAKIRREDLAVEAARKLRA